MNFPQPPRLPRWTDFSASQLQERGITRAQAEMMDDFAQAMMATTSKLCRVLREVLPTQSKVS
jgi:hypothetical protein